MSALLALLALAPLVPGDRLEAFQMLDAGGRTVEWRPGRVTVFSVCAFWCDTWKTQTVRLATAKGILGGLPVDFRTISTDGRWAEVARNSGPLWRDAGGVWSNRVGIDRVPTTIVVDRTGQVRFAQGGIVRSDDIVQSVHSALGGTAPAGGDVYLTFDDFPPANGGDELLDALRSLDVRATFFCVASRMEANGALLRRAVREGNSVQCHSWSHDAADPQLDKCRAVFLRVLRSPFRLYRAPGSEKIVGLASSPFVVDPYDYTRPGENELLRRVLSAVRPESEIQLHAGVIETLADLPEIVRRLRARGFRFEVLP